MRVVTERLGQAFRHIFGGYLGPRFDHRHVRGRNVDQVGQPVRGEFQGLTATGDPFVDGEWGPGATTAASTVGVHLF